MKLYERIINDQRHRIQPGELTEIHVIMGPDDKPCEIQFHTLLNGMHQIWNCTTLRYDEQELKALAGSRDMIALVGLAHAMWADGNKVRYQIRWAPSTNCTATATWDILDTTRTFDTISVHLISHDTGIS